jgi:DNA invertase Pin-like site-specific DNA recombinase
MPVQRQQKISENTSESQKNAKTKKKPNRDPTAVKTDIAISIKTQHMENIVSRVKNHEFRKYNVSTNIERMWYSEFAYLVGA